MVGGAADAGAEAGKAGSVRTAGGGRTAVADGCCAWVARRIDVVGAGVTDIGAIGWTAAELATLATGSGPVDGGDIAEGRCWDDADRGGFRSASTFQNVNR